VRNGAAAPVRDVVETPAEDMVAAPDDIEAIEVIIEPDADDDAEADIEPLVETPETVAETVKMAEDANVLHCDVAGVKIEPPFERACTFWAGGSLASQLRSSCARNTCGHGGKAVARTGAQRHRAPQNATNATRPKKTYWLSPRQLTNEFPMAP